MAAKLAQLVGAVAVVLALAGAVPLPALLRHLTGGVDGRVLLALIPVASAVGVFLLISRPAWGPIWTLAGLAWGFVLLGAFSIGGLFLPSAVALLLTAVLHAIAYRPGARGAILPLWFLTGATGTCALFFVLHGVWEGSWDNVAPIVRTGSQAFAVMSTLLAATYAIASRRSRRA